MLQKNECGFTLIEMMVAGAMLSIMVLAFSSYMINVSKQQKQIEVKNNMMMLRMQMDAAATDPAAITNSSSR